MDGRTPPTDPSAKPRRCWAASTLSRPPVMTTPSSARSIIPTSSMRHGRSPAALRHVSEAAQTGILLEHLFRREAGRILAHLTQLLGPAHLDLAEEAVQDAML